MMKIGLKLMKQLEVALFENVFSKTTIFSEFTLTHLHVFRMVQEALFATTLITVANLDQCWGLGGGGVCITTPLLCSFAFKWHCVSPKSLNFYTIPQNYPLPI